MTERRQEDGDEEVSERLRSFAGRTRDVGASRRLMRRLVAVADGTSQTDGFSTYILRLAAPALVGASVAAGVLFVVDRGDAGFDDDLASAATMEVAP